MERQRPSAAMRTHSVNSGMHNWLVPLLVNLLTIILLVI